MAGKSQEERKVLQLYISLIKIAHGQFVTNVVNQIVKTRAMLGQSATEGSFAGPKIMGNLLCCYLPAA